MNRNSCRSKPIYLPKFPRIQRLLKRREQEEQSLSTYVDEDYLIHVRPTTKRIH